MSWQLFVSKEGAVVDSVRQLPLVEQVNSNQGRFPLMLDLPNVRMTKMPPAYRLSVFNGHDVSNDLIL